MDDAGKSFVAVSMHKAGSSIAQSILSLVAKDMGFTPRLLEQEAYASPQPVSDYCIAAQADLQQERFFYGVLRGPYVERMPRLHDLRAIVLMRDPRDCITSLYYSRAFSHSPPPDPGKQEAFDRLRAQARESDIDSFALDQVRPDNGGNYVRRMRALRQIVEKHPDCLCVKYEKMVDRPDVWLREIGRFLRHPVGPALLRKVARIAEFRVATENPYAHRRQVRPGDHSRKLRPETVARLTASFREELQYFGYAVELLPQPADA